VTRVEEDSVVVEVLGVGYQVHVHQRNLAMLQAERDEVLLQVHTTVREDDISLYGFLSLEELALFRHLLAVERIGPKAALAILSRSEWRALVEAITNEDFDLLAAAPGIGPKTARRIVLELKGKLEPLAGATPRSAPAPAGAVAERGVEALVALGFGQGEARRAVAESVGEADPEQAPERTVEAVVRDALRRLGRSAGGARV
jgi:Holliday junction DNA helicase RuvA